MSAGLASGFEIAAAIIRKHQGTDMKVALAELNERRLKEKEVFERSNTPYTFGMYTSISYSLMALADWCDGCVTGERKLLLDAIVGEKP